MAARLASTVYVKDPTTRQTLILDEGTSPEPRLAALVTNPSAWVDGKLPRAPKTTPDGGPSAAGQDDASGDDSVAADPTSDDTATGSEDTKPAARKTAARKPAVRKPAAD